MPRTVKLLHRTADASSHPQRQTGFSLVELVVALVIMGLLFGTLVMPMAAQSDMRARHETDRALTDIRDALIGYAIVKGRLPCPAEARTASGTAGAGSEAQIGSNCVCTAGSNVASATGVTCSGASVVGVLPWSTLGLPESDAWGRRFTYSLDTQFGRAPGQGIFGCPTNTEPQLAGFALCSTGGISIKTASGGQGAVSGGVPAIVVSHGKNGFGAVTPQGDRIAIAGASADEQENANGDTVFVANSNIDDQSVWVPTPLLMHRMLSAGMLP